MSETTEDWHRGSSVAALLFEDAVPWPIET